jgi:hypothetical protein
MKTRRRPLACVFLIAAILGSACSLKPKVGATDAGEPGGATGDGGAGGAGGETTTISIFAGASGDPSGGTPGTGLSASDTVDGTVPIGADRASQLLKDPVANCQGWAVEASAQPSIIEFLVDVSGSMKETADSTAGESKWNVTRTALKNAIQTLPATYGIGVTFFPNMALEPSLEVRPVSACINSANDVALATATPEQRQKLLDALDAIVIDPLSATPTYDAYAIAVDQLKATTLVGSRYVVLITDGQPTQAKGCVGTGSAADPQPPDEILTAIGQAKSQSQIQTFVVGSPGSEKNFQSGKDARGWLSQAARAGNTAAANCSDSGPTFCHFDVSMVADFSEGLSDALTKITRSVMSCTFDVPVPTGDQKLDPAKVNMIYEDGKGGYYLVLPGNSEACDKGWAYGESQREVRVCGATCSLIQANPVAKLSILFGCLEKEIITLL